MSILDEIKAAVRHLKAHAPEELDKPIEVTKSEYDELREICGLFCRERDITLRSLYGVRIVVKE